MAKQNLDTEMDKRFKEVLSEWASKGTLPSKGSQRLEKIVKREAAKEKNRHALVWGSTSVAVATLFFVFLIMTSPNIRAWAGENIPIVGKYIAEWTDIEKGWDWAEEQGMFQEVIASTTDKGYTLNIHRVLADPVQTTVFYSLEGKDIKPIHWKEILFNGNLFAKGRSERGDIIDGILVGSLEFDALPKEKGELKLVVKSIGDIEGNWQVSFPITRKNLTQLSKNITINQEFEVPSGALVVEELQITPTQTAVVLSYLGKPLAPQLSTQNTTLLLDGEKIEPRGGSGSGNLQRDGIWRYDYQLRYQPLQAISPGSIVIIYLQGLVLYEGETRIPLEGNTATLSPDGRQVEIIELNINNEIGEGYAVISFQVDSNNPLPFMMTSWQVLDDMGNYHIADSSGHNNEEESIARPLLPGEEPEEVKERSLEIKWKIPPSSTAVELVISGYWIYDKIGIVTVELDDF